MRKALENLGLYHRVIKNARSDNLKKDEIIKNVIIFLIKNIFIKKTSKIKF